MKILLINGPPRSGKDALGIEVCRRVFRAANGWHAQRRKFATALKEMTHRLYDILHDDEYEGHVGQDAYEDSKDQPSSDFRGITPRQAYIGVSELLMKKLHGPRVFGEILRDNLKHHKTNKVLAAITDSGFPEEAQVMVEEFGRENVYLLHIHREGATFSGDSRGYVDLDLPMENKLRIKNDGTLDDLAADAEEVLRTIGVL